MILLGTIANAGSDVKTNLNTSVPFSLPNNARIFIKSASTTLGFLGKEGQDAAFAPVIGDMVAYGVASALVEVGALPNSTLAIRKTDAGASTTLVYAMKVPY